MCRRKSILSKWVHGLLPFVLVLSMVVTGTPVLLAAPMVGNPGIYSFDGDFEQGTLINLDHDTPVHDQLQLYSIPEPFNFIWVAASGRGTVVKINTLTGAVLGQYWSAPDGRGRNPSRTTVDSDGNVWTANRDEAAGNSGSIVKIGLKENGQCVDRNGNGVIETSTGLGDVLSWSNAGGADNNGGVSTAADECILVYQRLSNAPQARHVSIDANNDVWVAGYPFVPTTFYKLNGQTGAILASFAAPGCGGYGGLIDGNNVLWSASISQNSLLRYDLNIGSGRCIRVDRSYGLGIDSAGNIWNAMWDLGTIVKLNPAGLIQPGFPKPSGGNDSRGVVVTADDNVWVANSRSNTVTRLDNNGNLLATIGVGSQPTGVAVDGAGKVWVTNYTSHNAMRIDPATNLIDFTVSLGAGAYPYNYSDMTGNTLLAPPKNGNWTVTHDSGKPGAVWGKVSWAADTPGDSTLVVTAASSTDGVTFGAEEVVTNGSDLSLTNGQHLRVRVTFKRATTGESPVLYDLTILANQPPVADANGPYTTPEGSNVMLDGSGSYDPDADVLTFVWDLDSDGTFETMGVTPSFAGIDGPTSHPVALRVCDPYGECDTDSSSVEVTNVPPIANAGADQTVYRDELVLLQGTWTDPATSYDNLYAWTWDFTGDSVIDQSGSAAYGTAIAQSTSFATRGTYTLSFAVTDKDGGEGSDDLVVTVLNRDPVCTPVTPSISTIWPPNHKFVPVSVLGVTDPEGDPITIVITGIRQDEPVDTTGDGKFTPDGMGVGRSTAELRAERSGTPKVPGDGRVYHVGFTASDGQGGMCSGVVQVGVPHDQDKPVVDGGPLYDSTVAYARQGTIEEFGQSTFLPLVSR